jgi:type I restriction enzyme S subunit
MYWLRAAFLHLGVYEGVGNKTTIPNLSAARVKQLPIPLPSRAEQLGIALVLDHLDRRCKLEESRLASLRMLKAATMAKVFREGLRNEPLRETAAGAIPHSWACRPLGDLLEIAQYGLSLRGGPSGQVPILRMNCQDESRVGLDDLQYVNLDREALARFRLDRGDLLFNRTNSFELVGRTAIFDSDVEAVFASYLIRLRTNSKAIAPRFLNYYLNLSSTQQALKAFATRGVSQSNISASKLRLLQIPVPPLVEQEQIADHLDCVMREIALTKERLGRQEALFATVLSTLMTGALRLLPTFPELETLDAS